MIHGWFHHKCLWMPVEHENIIRDPYYLMKRLLFYTFLLASWVGDTLNQFHQFLNQQKTPNHRSHHSMNTRARGPVLLETPICKIQSKWVIFNKLQGNKNQPTWRETCKNISVFSFHWVSLPQNSRFLQLSKIYMHINQTDGAHGPLRFAVHKLTTQIWRHCPRTWGFNLDLKCSCQHRISHHHNRFMGNSKDPEVQR